MEFLKIRFYSAIKTYLDLFVDADSDLNKRKNILNKWYRKQLKDQVSVYMEKWQKIVGIEMPSFSIKQMKTKWGSCNIKKRYIWINLELSKKPLRCLEYVVLHEMVHLLERKHNDNFIAHMDKFLPQWRSCRDELNAFILAHWR